MFCQVGGHWRLRSGQELAHSFFLEGAVCHSLQADHWSWFCQQRDCSWWWSDMCTSDMGYCRVGEVPIPVIGFLQRGWLLLHGLRHNVPWQFWTLDKLEESFHGEKLAGLSADLPIPGAGQQSWFGIGSASSPHWRCQTVLSVKWQYDILRDISQRQHKRWVRILAASSPRSPQVRRPRGQQREDKGKWKGRIWEEGTNGNSIIERYDFTAASEEEEKEVL